MVPQAKGLYTHVDSHKAIAYVLGHLDQANPMVALTVPEHGKLSYSTFYPIIELAESLKAFEVEGAFSFDNFLACLTEQ